MADRQQRVRVLIADDHAIVREGLKALFDQIPNIDVVGEACDGSEAVRQARELQPDVVLMNVRMPELDGIEATRQICQQAPGVEVVGMAEGVDERVVREMLVSGATGYVTKRSSFRELEQAVQAAARGESYFCPRVTDQLHQTCMKKLLSGRNSYNSILTAREREVLQLLAEGRDVADIAEALDISQSTVAAHRRSVMEKLDATSVAEIVRYAIRRGLTSLEE